MSDETEAEKPGLVDRALAGVAGVLAKVTARKQAEAQAAVDRETSHREEYLDLMTRATPKRGDDERLEQLIIAMNLDPDAVKRDAAVIEQARKDYGLASRCEDAHAAFCAIRDEKKALAERHEAEMKAMDSKMQEARHQWDRASRSQTEIRKTERERPELFSENRLPFPPGLKRSEPPAPPRPVRKEPEIKINMGGGFGQSMVEPIVGEDGYYVRNEKGKYPMSGNVWSP